MTFSMMASIGVAYPSSTPPENMNYAIFTVKSMDAALEGVLVTIVYNPVSVGTDLNTNPDVFVNPDLSLEFHTEIVDQGTTDRFGCITFLLERGSDYVAFFEKPGFKWRGCGVSLPEWPKWYERCIVLEDADPDDPSNNPSNDPPVNNPPANNPPSNDPPGNDPPGNDPPANNPPATPVAATIDFDPDTLNLKSEGVPVTVYIELPGGYSVDDIDVATVTIDVVPVTGNDVSAMLHPTTVGDYDGDGIPDRMVKFIRADVQAILTSGPQTVFVTGSLDDGATFEGTDTIRAISPPP